MSVCSYVQKWSSCDKPKADWSERCNFHITYFKEKEQRILFKVAQMQTVNLLTKIGTSRTNSNISKQWNWNQFKLQWAGKSRCDGDSWKENNSGILAWIPEISQIFRRYGGIWKQPQFPSPSGACSTETPGMGFGVNWFQSEPGALSPTALRAWWWKSLVLESSWHIPEPENRERESSESWGSWVTANLANIPKNI